jgi:hypothetical protein
VALRAGAQLLNYGASFHYLFLEVGPDDQKSLWTDAGQSIPYPNNTSRFERVFGNGLNTVAASVMVVAIQSNPKK